MKRGYWGDVASSPFAAVGVECDEARSYQKSLTLEQPNPRIL